MSERYGHVFPVPIMTEAERNAIQHPGIGVIVEDIDTRVRWMWSGDEWVALVPIPKGYRELADR